MRRAHASSYDEHSSFGGKDTSGDGRARLCLLQHDTRIVNPISVERTQRMAHPRACFTLESLQTHLADVIEPGDLMLTTFIARVLQRAAGR